MESWRAILRHPQSPRVRCTNEWLVGRAGLALVVCREILATHGLECIDDLLKLPFSSITEENIRKHQAELDRLNAEIAETTRTYPHEFWLKDLSLLKV